MARNYFVKIEHVLAQPSRDFAHARSLSMWRGPNFDMARATHGAALEARDLWRSRLQTLDQGLVQVMREDAVQILMKSCNRSLHDLVQVLMRRPYGNPGEILQRGPCMKIFQMPSIGTACTKSLVGGSWKVLVSRSCKILSSSSRSFYDDLVRFS